jgi:hypothetical protein
MPAAIAPSANFFTCVPFIIVVVRHENASARPAVPNYFLPACANVMERLRVVAPLAPKKGVAGAGIEYDTAVIWLHCEKCQYYAPLGCAVAVIRWGAAASRDAVSNEKLEVSGRRFATLL